MAMKKEVQKLIDNELMKHIISVRINTLWKMLDLKRRGEMPPPQYEGATSDFDNKGGIFIPGGVVFEDSDERRIEYEPCSYSSDAFNDKIKEAMQKDNATLLFPDGIACGINLNNGFYSKAAREIISNKKATLRRKKTVSGTKFRYSSGDITRSHTPQYVPEPYGARTRLSSCVALALVDPPVYYTHCCSEYRMTEEGEEKFASRIDDSLKHVKGKDGKKLYGPYVVVCHDTRYKEEVLTGLTRILGIGKFGEFATFTLEEAKKSLLNRLDEKRDKFSPDEIIASYRGTKVAAVLRVYEPTNPGKRSPDSRNYLISPNKDLGIDLEEIADRAVKRYNL